MLSKIMTLNTLRQNFMDNRMNFEYHAMIHNDLKDSKSAHLKFKSFFFQKRRPANIHATVRHSAEVTKYPLQVSRDTL